MCWTSAKHFLCANSFDSFLQTRKRKYKNVNTFKILQWVDTVSLQWVDTEFKLRCLTPQPGFFFVFYSFFFFSSFFFPFLFFGCMCFVWKHPVPLPFLSPPPPSFFLSSSWSLHATLIPVTVVGTGNSLLPSGNLKSVYRMGCSFVLWMNVWREKIKWISLIILNSLLLLLVNKAKVADRLQMHKLLGNI